MSPLQPLYVAVCPVDLAENWDAQRTGLPNPVSVLHTHTTCSRCQALAWIGPEQRKVAREPNASIVCYRCIAADEDFLNSSQVPIFSVNPDIDDAPRRY